MTEQEKNKQPDVEEKRYLFGKLCESARVLADIRLTQLSETTKIPLKFLQAIESGEQNLGVSRVYARGFIRILCKYLQVDEKDYLKAFEDAHPQIENTQPSIEAISEVQKSTGQSSLLTRDRKPGLVRQVGQSVRAALSQVSEKIGKNENSQRSEVEAKDNRLRKIAPVLAGVVVVLGYTIFNEGYLQSDFAPVELTRPVVHAERQPVASQPVKPEVADSVDSPNEEFQPTPNEETLANNSDQQIKKDVAEPSVVEDAIQNLPATSVESADQVATVRPEGLSVVTVTAKDQVVLRVQKDDENRRNVELLTGNKLTLEFVSRVQLLIMDASRVSVSYNGDDLGSLGGSGRTRRISFENHKSSQKSQL